MMKLLGLPQTLGRLAQVAGRVAVAEEAATGVVKNGVAERARSEVAVDTGATRDSIETTEEGVRAGGAALYLEFGTVNMAAQPFLRPAADGASADVGEVEAILRSALGII